MFLAIDIGNTNIVVGGIDNDEIIFISRIATDILKTDDQYAIEIKNIIQLHNIDTRNIHDSIISSVVPPILNTIKNAIYKIIGIQPYVIGEDIKALINMIYDNVDSIGTDRIVNCISVLSNYKPPIIIFDMGTATTISVIDKDKNYIGGCIIPGIRTSLDALSLKASQLPYIKLEAPEKVIGSNTIQCMLSGIINGNASMIDGMIEKMEIDIGEKATVVATGGMAKFIIPNCKKEIKYNEHLLLQGLNIIYKNNRLF